MKPPHEVYTKTLITEMNDTAIKEYFYFKKNIFYFTKMFRSLHTSSSVVQIKSTANIQIIRDLLQCYSIDRNTCKNFCLTIFMAINTNITNETI